MNIPKSKKFSPYSTPPLLHFGGKWRISTSFIHDYIPSEMNRVTLFGGGAGEFLKLPKVTLEVYRDKNPLLVKFWLRLRDDHFNFAKEIFENIRDVEITPERFTDPEKGVNYLKNEAELFIHSHASYKGAGLRWCGGISAQKKSHVQRVSLLELHQFFRFWSERIQHWDIQEGDALDCLRDPNIVFGNFIYLDPPYLNSVRKSKDSRHKSLDSQTRKHYAFEFMSDEEHKTLLDKVLPIGLEAVMVSAYPSSLYDKTLLSESWERVDKPIISKGEVTSVESLYLSPGLLHRIKM